MAGVEVPTTTTTSVEDGSCGPVMQMMNKRLRALKKKMNRIIQIEDAKNSGKAVNKEQEDVLKAKAQVAALLDEYERLRQPLMAAVKEEIAEREREWSLSKAEAEEQQKVADDDVQRDSDVKTDENTSNTAENENGEDVAVAAAAAAEEEEEEDGVKVQSEEENGSGVEVEEHLAELLHLVYFAQLFDVVQRESNLDGIIKFHERASCLSYDQVTDEEDDAAPLDEGDLNALASFGSKIVSRPAKNTLSHKEALQNCIAHARNWLLSSDQPIGSDFGDLTYGELRERLNRILGSEYYTMIPELKTVPQQIPDAAVEHYVSKSASGFLNPLEVPEDQYGNGADSVSNSAGNVSDSSGNNADVSQDSTQVDTPEAVAPAEEAPPSDEPQVYQKHPNLQAPSQTGSNGELGQQQQQQQQRFRGRGGGYGRGRGYSGYSGRGGRGNRGGLGQNGGRQGQFYEQSGYYQQKNYYAGAGNNNSNYNTSSNHGRRGRGYYSNSNSNMNNNNNNSGTTTNNSQGHANGPAVAAQTG